jgi:hypothetical protein
VSLLGVAKIFVEGFHKSRQLSAVSFQLNTGRTTFCAR